MAQIPGSIPITGKVAPTDTTDTFATHVDVFGEGGYMTVADQAEREAITTERRKQGMAVFQNDTNEMYILQDGVANSNWTLFSGGSSVQSTKVTLTAADILNLHNTPVDLIPAPGSGKIINLINFISHYDFNTTPYTLTNNQSQIRVRFVGATSTQQTLIAQNSTLESTVDAWGATNNWPGFPFQVNTTVLVPNAALQASIPATSPVTLGDSPIHVYLQYMIITL